FATCLCTINLNLNCSLNFKFSNLHAKSFFSIISYFIAHMLVSYHLLPSLITHVIHETSKFQNLNQSQSQHQSQHNTQQSHHKNNIDIKSDDVDYSIFCSQVI